MPDGLSHNRRCALSTVASQITGTHSDFPVLLTRACFPDEMFDPSGSHPSQADGGDVRLSSDSAGSTLMALDVVSWELDSSSAAGDANIEVWAKFPTVRDSQADTVYAWYDTPSGDSQPAVTAANGRNAVWSGYFAVWHGDDTTDASGNGNTLTGTGAPTAGAAGKIGGAFSFDGSNYYETTAAVWTNEPVTLSAWAKLNTTTGNQTILASAVGSGDGFQRTAYIDYGKLRNQKQATDGVTTQNADTSGMGSGTWHLTHGTCGGDASRDIFLDGGSKVSDTGSAGDGTYTHTNIGVLNEAGSILQYWNGLLDEVRVASSVLSDNWIATEHASQNAPGSFISVGTPAAAAASITLTPADASHAQGASNVTLSQIHDLAIAAAAEAQAAQAAVLGQTHLLSVAVATQAQSADSVLLYLQQGLIAAGCAHAHSAGQVALAQLHFLSAVDAAESQSAQAAHLLLASQGAPAARTLAVAQDMSATGIAADTTTQPIGVAGGTLSITSSR